MLKPDLLKLNDRIICVSDFTSPLANYKENDILQVCYNDIPNHQVSFFNIQFAIQYNVLVYMFDIIPKNTSQPVSLWVTHPHNTNVILSDIETEKKKYKTSPDICRVCNTKGNANYVNHKEYYYCPKCKDEC